MRGSLTKDELEQLRAAGFRDPAEMVPRQHLSTGDRQPKTVPTCSVHVPGHGEDSPEDNEAKGKSPADFDPAILASAMQCEDCLPATAKMPVNNEPTTIPSGGVRSDLDSGARREGFLPKPFADRYNPKGMRIRGATMTEPCSRGIPNSKNKGKKIEQRRVGHAKFSSVLESASESEGAEKPGCSSNSGKVAPKVKKQQGRAKQSEGIITESDINHVNAQLTCEVDPRMRVKFLLKQFEEFRRRYVRDTDERRPDLKALEALSKFRYLVNGQDKSIYGHVPGVEVWDRYNYLAEANLISLHRMIRGGIDVISKRESTYKDSAANPVSVAVSVVISPTGSYANTEFNDSEFIWYVGQGGTKDKSNSQDQKLVRGNLALKNSYKQRLSVRVIRGSEVKKDPSHSGRVYEYLGL
ncbi:unnamed protein product [Calypogeia fissa]